MFFQCYCMAANKWQPPDSARWPPAPHTLSASMLTASQTHAPPQGTDSRESPSPCPFIWVSFPDQEKLRFPELVPLVWLLLQFADKHEHSQTCKSSAPSRGGRGRLGGGRDRTQHYGKVFHQPTIRCLLYTHMPNEKKKNHQISQNNLI